MAPSNARSAAASTPGVEEAARAGYAAKGVVYAVVGGLAVQQAVGAGGGTSGSREALQEIAGAPFGKILLGLVSLGLVAYVLWRLVQAFLDPEGGQSDDGQGRRWAKRAFYLLSAALYGGLAYYGVTLVLGSGGGGGSGSGGWAAELLAMRWGAWLLGAVGVGIVIRGIVQFVKAYTESFRDRIDSFDLGRARQRWAIRSGRIGLTARGVVFGIIGTSVCYAALTRDPGQARQMDGALQVLVGRPWLLGAVGVGLMAYAVYQWVKARYRLIGA